MCLCGVCAVVHVYEPMHKIVTYGETSGDLLVLVSYSHSPPSPSVTLGTTRQLSQILVEGFLEPDHYNPIVHITPPFPPWMQLTSLSFLHFLPPPSLNSYPSSPFFLSLSITSNLLSPSLPAAPSYPLHNSLTSVSSSSSQLWQNFFQVAVAFMCQSNLQLEGFSEIKRKRIMDWWGFGRVVAGMGEEWCWGNSRCQWSVHVLYSSYKIFYDVKHLCPFHDTFWSNTPMIAD